MVISRGEVLDPGCARRFHALRTPRCSTSTAPPRPRSYTTLWVCRRAETRRGSHRAADRQHARSTCWTRSAAGAGRRARRAVHRRRRPGPRLPEPAGARRRAVRPRSVRAGSRGRGCTGPATSGATCPTASSSSWAARSPGQGARLPHRAGRDRGGAGAARAVREAVVVLREDAGRQAAGRLRGAARRRLAGADLRACAAQAARLHGARRVRAARALPLTRTARWIGSALPAPAISRQLQPAGASTDPVEAALAAMARGAGPGPRRHRRQLLRSGRALAAGHPPDRAGSGKRLNIELSLRRSLSRPTVARAARRQRTVVSRTLRKPPLSPRA